ncbi:MAG: TonB C-terminal domain-containing protein [Candidatus Desulfofervidaceae bacterium]|nr:TonB C-terminal domain-containing protein [Candidatus Desulfofervidaceae bacterium]
MFVLTNSSFKSSLLVSLLLHFLLLTLVFFTTTERKQYLSFSPVYKVRLVEIPRKIRGKVVKKKGIKTPSAKTKTQKKQVKVVPASKKKAKLAAAKAKKQAATKAIPLKKAKKRTKAAVSKKTDDKEMKMVESKIKALQKKVEERKKQEEIKKEVAQIAEEVQKGAAGEVIGEYAEGEPTGKGIGLAFQLYYNQVWEKIKSNWVLPSFLIKKAERLEAIVVIKIARDGHIIEKQFEEKSGYVLFDQSIEEALKKSDPLPPLPQGYIQPYHEIGIRFRWTREGKEIG